MLNLLILILFPYLGCNNLDIMVLADYSGSVLGNEKFVHQAIYSFGNKLDISEDNVNLGIITFNSYTDLLCPLSSDKTEVMDKIEIMSNFVPKGTTDLGSALYGAFDELSNKGRENYKKIIIVICDGAPDYPQPVQEIASNLKDIGIQIYTILINSRTSNSEYMYKLASPNSFYNTDFPGLTKTLEQINLCL